ncbi:MAG TPA: hypothetical protein VJT80_06770, partial [Steroidobacteraceae bacterium]|nr:hypothetical protein [Steroidobacteraceae bacterium]
MSAHALRENLPKIRTAPRHGSRDALRRRAGSSVLVSIAQAIYLFVGRDSLRALPDATPRTE